MAPEATAGDLIAEARNRLRRAGVDGAALDARLLFQAAAGLDHAAVVSEPGRIAGPAAAARFAEMVARRAAGEPVSRILGHREFYGRDFIVTPAVLDPRPDTETVVTAALSCLRSGARLLDLGTGSGAIAIALLLECPSASGVATDISLTALAVAEKNARRHGVAGRLELAHGNWFEPVRGCFELIASNPPYIPMGDIATLAREVRDFDPVTALDGGPDGLEAYRRIAARAGVHLASGGALLVEIGAGQKAAVKALFGAYRWRLTGVQSDLGGHPRCLTFAQG